MSKFWNFIKNAATEKVPENIELRIEGDIVDDSDAWIYEWFGEKCATPNAFKTELANYAGKDLTVWIDSYGGSVFAAAGIYNSLKEHKGNITVKIDGKAMSAASLIAMAGDKILMSPIAILMIHNPLTDACGYASDLRKTADVLDEVKQAIVNAYELKSGRSRAKISDMMDNETYLSAKTAIKEGFADGMLYGDVEKVEVMNFNFLRTPILNSTNEAVKRMMEKEKAETAPKNATELEKLKLKLQLSL